ncbi:hypothetical protein [Nonomuraea salmonea]|uniref:hypothetical protein n=1 Tax=Nonomuraea salmonea TaxID=46181 RepID=UPI0031EDBA54
MSADESRGENATARGVAMAREKLAQAKADAAKRGQLPRREPRRKAKGPRREAGDPQLFRTRDRRPARRPRLGAPRRGRGGVRPLARDRGP